MKYLIIFLLIVSVVLTILIVRQNREIKDLQNQVNKCKADILQWSKLSQYAEEFHAIPDSTAPFDTSCSLQFSEADNMYTYYINGKCRLRAVERNSGCPPSEDMTFKYKAYYLSDKMWPDDRDKKTRATKVISDTNNFGSMWCIDECGNETRYKRVNGKWILQKD